MRHTIDRSLGDIKLVRVGHSIMKKKLVEDGTRIVDQKKRAMKCAQLLSFLELAATISKSLPSITALINAGKFDLAVTLLQHTEAQYNAKFSKVIAFNHLRDQLFLVRQKLEKGISTSFMDKQLEYVISELNYTKGGGGGGGGTTTPLSGSSSLDDSTVNGSLLANESIDQSQYD